MGYNKKEGYWWECTECDYWQKDPSIVTLIRSLKNSNWDQKLLTQPCPQANCTGLLRIAFFKNIRSKKIILLYHVVGISHDDKIREPVEASFGSLIKVTAYLPMMWEWKYKFPKENSENSESYFDFKHLNTERPNLQTLTNIVSLTQHELERLFELYRQRTKTKNFPKQF